MSANTSNHERTAQKMFSEMIKSVIAPVLRDYEFRGSRNAFSKELSHCQCSVGFQKSIYSNRIEIEYCTNIAVVHTPTMDEFYRKRKDAGSNRRFVDVPVIGNWFSRLERLDPTLNGQWRRFSIGSSVLEAGESWLKSFEAFGLPAILEEVRKAEIQKS